MKRTKNMIWMAVLAVGMAMTCVTMTSCAKEDNPVNDEPEFDEETLRAVEGIPQTGTDELLLFQNHIVEIDSVGNFVRRMYGMPLDPADPNILSIGVEDLAEARAIFEDWLPDEPVMTENAPNVLTFYPKDEEGNPQGEIYFTPSDADDLIAKVTFSEGTNLLHFTTICFIPNALWPDIPNLANPFYKLWEIIPNESLEKYLHSDYQCIRVKGNGKMGLLATVSVVKYNPAARIYLGNDNGASESISKEVSSIIRDNWFNWAYKNEGEEVWTDKREYRPLLKYGYYTINLKNGKFTQYNGLEYYYLIYPNRNAFKLLYVKEF